MGGGRYGDCNLTERGDSIPEGDGGRLHTVGNHLDQHPTHQHLLDVPTERPEQQQQHNQHNVTQQEEIQHAVPDDHHRQASLVLLMLLMYHDVQT